MDFPPGKPPRLPRKRKGEAGDEPEVKISLSKLPRIFAPEEEQTTWFSLVHATVNRRE